MQELSDSAIGLLPFPEPFDSFPVEKVSGKERLVGMTFGGWRAKMFILSDMQRSVHKVVEYTCTVHKHCHFPRENQKCIKDGP